MEVLVKERLSGVAEVSLSYSPKVRPSQRPTVTSAKDAYEILMGFWNLDQIELRESFCVMLLNRNLRVLGVVELSRGGISSTVADTRMIFGVALKACACSIIVAHNHPSGDLKASSADIKVTNKLVEAGRILELPVNDHLIVTREGYLSLAEEGYLD
ncbi:JAB domain-containing protein [Pedobacter sp.]